MGSIITIVKIIMFLFPFIKEVFAQKERDKIFVNHREVAIKAFFKNVIIAAGCLSVVMNFYIVGKVYNLGRENIALKKQIKDNIPKPIIYPKKDVQPTENEVALPEPAIEETLEGPIPIKNEDIKKIPKRLPKPSVDKEKFLKELEQINKIV